MFEHPGFPTREFVRTGTKARFRSKFREDEIRDFGQSKKENLERYVKSTNVKGSKEQVHYLGLTSNDVYDEEGNVLQTSQKFNATPDTGFSRRIGYSPLRLYELAQMGLHNLPRSSQQPYVVKKPMKIRNKARLSAKASILVARSNYKAHYWLTLNSEDDDWIHRGFRVKHLQTLVTILHISILRSDLETAWRVFPLLIRFADVDVRQYWTIGIELLNYRYGNLESGLKFLDWLFINYPSGRSYRKSLWKIWPRSQELLPYLLLMRLVSYSPRDVCEQLEDLVLSKPYTADPNVWILHGISLLQLGQRSKARAKFQKSIELGAWLPQPLLRASGWHQ